MSDLNRFISTGRLTRDAQLRFTPTGTAVCDVGVASNRFYKDRDGNRQEETTFYDITLWGNKAENLSQYLTKGTKVSVEGRLKLDQWEKDGQKRSKLVVVCEDLNFLGGGNGGGAKNNSQPKAESVSAKQELVDEEVPF